MSTLETQYRKFLEANQKLKLSFEEWKKVNARLIKQALINMIKDDEELGLYDEPTKCYCSHTVTCDCGPEEPKQETLEEAAERLAIHFNIDFNAGAKWQQEQDKNKYSEEEVIDIAKQAFVLGKDFGLIGTFKEWFDTVKKK